MYPNLVKHVRNYVELSDDQAAILVEHVKPLELKKNDHVLRDGQVCRENYFVETGGLCMYFINDKGVEKLTQFALGSWWIGDYLSMTLQQPSGFFIKAFENSLVLSIDIESQEKVYSMLPQMERYTRLMMQRGYGSQQARLRFIRSRTAEQSYHTFRDLFPEFVQRIPQYMLASYLGLTPEYLSELRKKDNIRIS